LRKNNCAKIAAAPASVASDLVIYCKASLAALSAGMPITARQYINAAPAACFEISTITAAADRMGIGSAGAGLPQ
jgi:hypothetical protein